MTLDIEPVLLLLFEEVSVFLNGALESCDPPPKASSAFFSEEGGPRTEACTPISGSPPPTETPLELAIFSKMPEDEPLLVRGDGLPERAAVMDCPAMGKMLHFLWYLPFPGRTALVLP